MNSQKLLNHILGMLRMVKDDKQALEKIKFFMENEVITVEPLEDALEFNFEEIRAIPEQYKKAVKEIAENMSCGLTSYLNTQTLEILDIPNNPEFDLEDEFEDYLEPLNEWEHYLTFEPLESHESFRIMEHFADIIPDKSFQEKLYNSLNRPKPFRNFKYDIDNSDYREKWFEFKDQQHMIHVWREMEHELEKRKIK